MVKSTGLSRGPRAENVPRRPLPRYVYAWRVCQSGRTGWGKKNNAPAPNDYYRRTAINFNVLARFRPGRLLLLPLHCTINVGMRLIYYFAGRAQACVRWKNRLLYDIVRPLVKKIKKKNKKKEVRTHYGWAPLLRTVSRQGEQEGNLTFRLSDGLSRTKNGYGQLTTRLSMFFRRLPDF